jgi:hypothetical protein
VSYEGNRFEDNIFENNWWNEERPEDKVQKNDKVSTSEISIQACKVLYDKSYGVLIRFT